MAVQRRPGNAARQLRRHRDGHADPDASMDQPSISDDETGEAEDDRRRVERFLIAELAQLAEPLRYRQLPGLSERAAEADLRVFAAAGALWAGRVGGHGEVTTRRPGGCIGEPPLRSGSPCRWNIDVSALNLEDRDEPGAAARHRQARSCLFRTQRVLHDPSRSDAVPELTTTSGEVIDFDPAAVTAICDMAPDTGESVTCVYGIEPGVVRTDEPVANLLQRLHLAAKAARLTRLDVDRRRRRDLAARAAVGRVRTWSSDSGRRQRADPGDTSTLPRTRTGLNSWS